MQVFGVSGQPSSVTVNGSPVRNFNYNVSTKVNISRDGPSGLGTSDGLVQLGKKKVFSRVVAFWGQEAC